MDKLTAANIAIDSYLRISSEINAINQFLLENGINNPTQLENTAIIEEEKEFFYNLMALDGHNLLNMVEALENDKTQAAPMREATILGSIA